MASHMNVKILGAATAALLLLSWIPLAEGHGRMVEPPSRSSMWRYGYNTPHDYLDNQLFCGGFTNQWERNAGKCGICGDPWDGEREHEAGGKFAQGIIVRRYMPGAVILVVIELTAPHRGWFEFRICPNNNVHQPATWDCLNRHVLSLANGKGPRYYVTQSYPMKHEVLLQLPTDMECAQCVLQWKYNSGNNWGIGPKKGCTGCGNQEQFYACADIAVGNKVLTQEIRNHNITLHKNKSQNGTSINDERLSVDRQGKNSSVKVYPISIKAYKTHGRKIADTKEKIQPTDKNRDGKNMRKNGKSNNSNKQPLTNNIATATVTSVNTTILNNGDNRDTKQVITKAVSNYSNAHAQELQNDHHNKAAKVDQKYLNGNSATLSTSTTTAASTTSPMSSSEFESYLTTKHSSVTVNVTKVDNNANINDSTRNRTSQRYLGPPFSVTKPVPMVKSQSNYAIGKAGRVQSDDLINMDIFTPSEEDIIMEFLKDLQQYIMTETKPELQGRASDKFGLGFAEDYTNAMSEMGVHGKEDPWTGLLDDIGLLYNENVLAAAAAPTFSSITHPPAIYTAKAYSREPVVSNTVKYVYKSIVYAPVSRPHDDTATVPTLTIPSSSAHPTKPTQEAELGDGGAAVQVKHSGERFPSTVTSVSSSRTTEQTKIAEVDDTSKKPTKAKRRRQGRRRSGLTTWSSSRKKKNNRATKVKSGNVINGQRIVAIRGETMKKVGGSVSDKAHESGRRNSLWDVLKRGAKIHSTTPKMSKG